MIIAIEGIDGSGKNTQATILTKRLEAYGKNVIMIGFPCYSETFFGKEVGNYLNGDFGSLEIVPPKLASILYAGDRFEKKKQICDAIESGAIVVIDRYVSSNIAHQSAKVWGAERDQLQEWIRTLEYNIFGLPKPTLNILLELDTLNSSKLVLKKDVRNYTDKAMDIHEEDTNYLSEVSNVYHHLASNSQNWKVINCSNGGNLRDINEISDDLFAAVVSIL